MFSVEDKVFDLIKLVKKTEVNFRSQTYYHFDCGPIIIFDMVVSIGVSTCEADFLSLDKSKKMLRGHCLHGVSNHTVIKSIGMARCWYTPR